MRWPDPPGSPEPLAWFGDCLATGLVDVTSDPAALDSAGWWAVVADFEGGLTCARFADVRPAALPAAPWQGPRPLGLGVVPVARRLRHRGRARPHRDRGRRGLPGQRVPGPLRAGPARRRRGRVWPVRWRAATPRRTPGCCGSRPPASQVVTASPELFLRRRGDVVESGPIKGTGRTAADLLRQGPRRERDDRRPGAQRPRPGRGHRVGRGPRAVHRRGAPGPGAPGVHGAGPAAPGRRAGPRSSPRRSRPAR